MPYVTLTHDCGHQESHSLPVRMKDRAYRRSWLEGSPCSDCVRAAANQIAKAQNAEAGLPTLTGSVKQVAWAETIRAQALSRPQNDVDAVIARFTALLTRGGHVDLIPAMREYALHAHKTLLTQTDAHWWIDNKSSVDILVSDATLSHYDVVLVPRPDDRAARQHHDRQMRSMLGFPDLEHERAILRRITRLVVNAEQPNAVGRIITLEHGVEMRVTGYGKVWQADGGKTKRYAYVEPVVEATESV